MKIPDDATAARYEKSYQKCIEFTGRMYKAGIPVVAGTDGLAGFTLQRELELYVMAGMTPAQALCRSRPGTAPSTRRCWTTAARSLPASAPTSSWWTAIPTQDIADIRKVALVFKDGNAYYPAEIYGEIGVKPFTAALRVEGPAAK